MRKHEGAVVKSDILQTSFLSFPDDSWGFCTLMGKFTLYLRETLLRVLVSLMDFPSFKLEPYVTGDDDSVDAQCQIKTVPNIFVGNILDHVSLYRCWNRTMLLR